MSQSVKIYLNERNTILIETKDYVLMEMDNPHINNKVPYKKNSNFYLSNLPRDTWSNVMDDKKCCVAIWERHDKERYKRFDLIISHNIDDTIKNYKVASPLPLKELPNKIKSEILLEEI